jgi:hypothetical protein
MAAFAVERVVSMAWTGTSELASQQAMLSAATSLSHRLTWRRSLV